MDAETSALIALGEARMNEDIKPEIHKKYRYSEYGDKSGRASVCSR